MSSGTPNEEVSPRTSVWTGAHAERSAHRCGLCERIRALLWTRKRCLTMLGSSQKLTQLASRRTAAHWVVRLPSGWRTIDRTKCVMQPADATASQFCCCYCIHT